MSWSVKMPSNIALIKYMGKKDVEKNIPVNSSLSWTLDHLTTEVRLEVSDRVQDSWEPLPSDFPFPMSERGRDKYLSHGLRLKKALGIENTFFKIQSANGFPADCGIASSASSFAALTEAYCQASEFLGGKTLTPEERALLSARGSGSSCRSFYPGWVEWNENSVQEVTLPQKDLIHMVALAGIGTKKVNSSEAHKRVQSSRLFEGRVGRAMNRLTDLKKALESNDWEQAFQVTWAEFWDMHSLFETSTPAFGYFLPETLTILNSARRFWEAQKDGPLVTMDAGPNVHFLWRPDQKDQALRYFEEHIKGNYSCMASLGELSASI